MFYVVSSNGGGHWCLQKFLLRPICKTIQMIRRTKRDLHLTDNLLTVTAITIATGIGKSARSGKQIRRIFNNETNDV